MLTLVLVSVKSVIVMNRKNNEKRKFVRLSAVAHSRLKTFSGKTGIKLERLVDDAVFQYLKLRQVERIPVLRAENEE